MSRDQRPRVLGTSHTTCGAECPEISGSAGQRPWMNRSAYVPMSSSAWSALSGESMPTAIHDDVRIVVTPTASRRSSSSGFGAASGDAMISKGRSAVPAFSRSSARRSQWAISSSGVVVHPEPPVAERGGATERDIGVTADVDGHRLGTAPDASRRVRSRRTRRGARPCRPATGHG